MSAVTVAHVPNATIALVSLAPIAEIRFIAYALDAKNVQNHIAVSAPIVKIAVNRARLSVRAVIIAKIAANARVVKIANIRVSTFAKIIIAKIVVPGIVIFAVIAANTLKGYAAIAITEHNVAAIVTVTAKVRSADHAIPKNSQSKNPNR